MSIDKQALREAELLEINELLRGKVKQLEEKLWDTDQLRKVHSEKSFELEGKVRELEARNQKDFVWRGEEIGRLNDEVDELKEKIQAAEKRIAELEAGAEKLPPLNDDLIAILGRPNFTCSHLAELMRQSGNEIRRKSEHEQAAVIHWLLGLYLEHGDKWEGVAKAEIQTRVAAAGISVKGE